MIGMIEWQLPEETYQKKTGDCEDSALLFMCFAWDMGFNPKMAIGYNNNGYHAIVKISDIYYDSNSMRTWSGAELPYTVFEVLSYAMALYRAETG